jgi:hypothetical protein
MAMTWQVEEGRYADILRPIFFRKTDALELACTLIGVSGMADGGWDTIEESRKMLHDLTLLRSFQLPDTTFSSPTETNARLCLLGYVHLVEMNAPYHMIVNLLRIHLGNRYHVDPFGDLRKSTKKQDSKKQDSKKQDSKKQDSRKKLTGLKRREPTPGQKIDRIKQWAAARRVPELGVAFDEFYSAEFRNSVAHSDYVLWGDEFRMASPPRSLPMSDVWNRIDRTLGFYSAFFNLEMEARQVFSEAKGQRLKVADGDELEFLVDDNDRLFGFRFYWADGGTSECSRSSEGRVARNVWFPDGEIEFLTGLGESGTQPDESQI